MHRVIRALIVSLVLILVALGSFLGGVLASGRVDVPVVGALVPTSTLGPGELLDKVRGIIAKDALSPSSDESITANAIRGALESLGDPYAQYFDAQQYAELQQDQTGEFFGIGVTLGLNADGQPQAATVFEGTPAAIAKIKTGDVFTAVNGQRRAKWDLDEFVSLVRGPLGTKVTLEVTRKGMKPFDVTLTRDRIAVPNTMEKAYGDVGYIRLMTFNELSAQDVSKAIAKADAKGAKGYILDLRGNPGGLLSSAVEVASLFVESGVIVRVDERGKPEELQRALGGAITTKPLVLLVDGNSASASEIVAGALKDYARATIVGQTTYGKGSVQSVISLGNGGAVKLTIAHYLTPLGKVMDKVGVAPDVVVEMDPQKQGDDATDTQLKRALSVVRGKL